MVTMIAKRLPYLRRRDVKEVIAVMLELWNDELLRPHGEIQFNGIGRLYVETHPLRATGIVRQHLRQKWGANAPQTVTRLVVRFRASHILRAAISAAYEKVKVNE
jgi:hypothetical protein